MMNKRSVLMIMSFLMISMNGYLHTYQLGDFTYAMLTSANESADAYRALMSATAGFSNVAQYFAPLNWKNYSKCKTRCLLFNQFKEQLLEDRKDFIYYALGNACIAIANKKEGSPYECKAPEFGSNIAQLKSKVNAAGDLLRKGLNLVLS